MLKLKNVSKFYYDKGVVATGFIKANLELNMGEFVVITGESGSGKTTLLNVISGLDSYEEGEMYINGKETSHYTEKEFEEYRKKYIANIFQDFNLINSYTVYQNIELMMLLNGENKKQIKKQVLQIIEQVGLIKFKNTKVSKLSGGQKQRVAIARTIVKNTPIIVADEPTGNLDTEAAENVIEILENVAKNKLVIIVTHNIEQFEKYATRIIKMHDGEIIENREIKSVEKNINVEEYKCNKIKFINVIKLGLRNTFNIKTKFILLFFIFFFITSALLLEYSNFKLAEYQESLDGNNINFKDMSENRILIKKEDNTPFSEEDYNKIKKLSNIDYLVKNDLFLDCNVRLYRSSVYGNMEFNCSINSVENIRTNLDIGRMPENDDESILQTSKINNKIKTSLDEIIEKRFSIGDYAKQDILKNIKIVGIIFNEKIDNYDSKIYVSNLKISELNSYINEKYSTTSISIDGKNTNVQIFSSANVEKGHAVINEGFGNDLLEKNILINVENIFCNNKLNFIISDIFSLNNYKNYAGDSQYQYYVDSIFINKEDYNNLYNLPLYQSSVFVKDINNIDKTILELNNLGINSKKIIDYKIEEIKLNEQILKILKFTVTILLIFILFFISYFIIKIILKSRNIYYAILRILGASKKIIKNILDIELLLISNIAYFTTILIIYLIKINIFKIKYIQEILNYLNIKEYIFIYLIIIFMAKIISIKFSESIFKKNAINTYNEEEM